MNRVVACSLLSLLPIAWTGMATAPAIARMVSSGEVARGDAQEPDQSAAEEPSLSLLRSVSLPLPAADTDGSKRAVDTFMDWDAKALTSVDQSGRIATMPLGKNWHFVPALDPAAGLFAMAVERKTGASYFLEGGRWAPIEEPEGEQLLFGDYEVFFQILANKDSEGSAYAMRFDVFSGRSWLLERNKWISIEGNLVGWPAAQNASGDNGGEGR